MKGRKLPYKLIIPIFIFFVFYSACSGNKPVITSVTAPQKESLDFRITWKTYSGRGEAIQKIVDLYNEKNKDGYEIEMTDGDEDISAIENLLLKSDSNTIYVLPYRYVKYFGGKGLLVDLTSYFEKEKDLFYTELWDLAVIGKETYGIPWLGHAMCLLYNKSILEKAGIDGKSIKSLKALLNAMETVEAKTNAKGIGLVGANHNDVSWMVNQFIYGFGSSMVDKYGKKVTINNEKSKEAVSYYKNVLGKHAQPTWVDDTGMEVMNYFRKQQVAFEIQGIWGVTDVEKNGNPFDVGIIALPDIGLPSEIGPMMLAITKSMSDAKKGEAINFMKFLISKQAQEAIMAGEFSPEHDAYYPFRTPVRKDLGDSLVFEKYPEYLTFIEGFKKPSIDVPVPKWQVIKDKFYAPGLHKVMKDEITIDDFLGMLELEGNKILEE